MEHLTIEEMIDFVSFDELSSDTLALAGKVNAHIAACEVCRNKVAAFQTIYDEFVKLAKPGNFREIMNEKDQKIAAGINMEQCL